VSDRGDTPPVAARAATPELRRGLELGRYVLLDPVGSGAMGVVWAAYDPKLDRRVAIKLLRAQTWLGPGPPAHERFLREAQSMARLSHPNVAIVHDVGVAFGRVFLAMDFVEGETLGAWLERPHGSDEIVARFVAAGRGLAAAHDHGIVHGDFGPEDVLLGARGRVCVTDFGFAHGEDACADQHAFCVAMWRGLIGAPPLEGDTSRVAPAIVRALRRGLAEDPARRFPHMHALLAALVRDREAARRRAAAIGLGAAVVGVAVWSFARRPATVTPCSGAAERLVGVWDDARRREVAAALVGTQRPYAAAAVAGVQDRLDAYAQDWIAMRVEACEATALRGEQSPELLDRRMACLDDRRAELSALVEVLAKADDAVAAQAVRAADRLAPLSGCADAERLLAASAGPQEPELAREIEALRGELWEIQAFARAGRPREALPRSDALLARAEPLGWAPIVAEIRAARGRARAVVGDYEGAADDLAVGYELALEHRLDAIAADTAAELVFVVGYKQLHPENGLAWLRHALPLALRVGRDDVAEAKVRNHHAVVLMHMGDLDAAEREMSAALAISERRLGPTHVDVADTRVRLADVLQARSEFERAEALYRQSIADLEAALGPDHPHLVPPIANLATSSLRRMRPDDAVRGLERALAIQEASLGADHPDVVLTLTNLGNVWLGRHEPARARAYYERARELATARFGPDSMQVAGALVNLGTALHELGQREEARATFERTLAIWEKGLGGEHVALAYPLVGLGNVLVDLRAYEEAVAALERALTLRTRAHASPVEIADARWGLALALWNGGSDRRRARALAEEARAIYVEVGGASTPTREKIDAWLAENDQLPVER
jgi:tetratricopeptide (TPR) repeat protein